jgi:hypothetical protein
MSVFLEEVEKKEVSSDDEEKMAEEVSLSIKLFIFMCIIGCELSHFTNRS